MASIERIKTKVGKKTIIRMPINYGYFIPEYTRKPSNRAGKSDKFEYNEEDSAPILVNLKTGVATEDESLRWIRSLDSGYCPIAANSKDNPVKLTYTPSSRLRSVSAIEYISILEYKDTGNVTFTFTESEICWVRSTERTFRRKRVTYKLTIRHGDKTTMTENGVMCLTNTALSKAFNKFMPLMRVKYIARYRGYVILKKMFIKHYLGKDKMRAREFDGYNNMQLIELYRVKQNPKLKDLPWTELQLGHIYNNQISLTDGGARRAYDGERSVSNVKVSLNRYLRRGDTKQAIEACFYGFVYPKSIKKVMLKTLPLEFEFNVYKNIFDLAQLQGTDIARNFISNADKTPNRDNITNPYYMQLLDMGFSWQQVSQHRRRYMRDVIDMHIELTENEGFTLEFVPNLVEYHDYLVRLSLEVREQRRELYGIEDVEWVNRDNWHKHGKKRRMRLELGFNMINTSEQMPRFEKDGLIFRSPRNSNELTEVGRRLRICVGSYREDFFLGKLDIVLMTKIEEDETEKYVGCLEVKQKKLVQAKLHSNRAVFRELPLLKVLKQWAKQNKIKLATSDVGVRGNSWVEDNPVNIERMEFLADERDDATIAEDLRKSMLDNNSID